VPFKCNAAEAPGKAQPPVWEMAGDVFKAVQRPKRTKDKCMNNKCKFKYVEANTGVWNNANLKAKVESLHQHMLKMKGEDC